VLQNRNTASAAEIFAAVLHEYKNAPLVGETTKGKGVVQSGYRLGDGSYLTVTVCAYRAGTGAGYHGTGIAPTVPQAVTAGYETTSIFLLPAAHDLPLSRALSAAAGVE
jgi:carboxyl-terminal processing protease